LAGSERCAGNIATRSADQNLRVAPASADCIVGGLKLLTPQDICQERHAFAARLGNLGDNRFGLCLAATKDANFRTGTRQAERHCTAQYASSPRHNRHRAAKRKELLDELCHNAVSHSYKPAARHSHVAAPVQLHMLHQAAKFVPLCPNHRDIPHSVYHGVCAGERTVDHAVIDPLITLIYAKNAYLMPYSRR
jgi:hypothetical protein